MFPNRQIPRGVPGEARMKVLYQNSLYANKNPAKQAILAADRTVRTQSRDYANAAAGTRTSGVWIALGIMAVIAIVIFWHGYKKG